MNKHSIYVCALNNTKENHSLSTTAHFVDIRDLLTCSSDEILV